MASVLIVDDDATVCDLLERFVRFAGYEAASVRDARSALEAMASSPPDVVLVISIYKMDPTASGWPIASASSTR